MYMYMYICVYMYMYIYIHVLQAYIQIVLKMNIHVHVHVYDRAASFFLPSHLLLKHVQCEYKCTGQHVMYKAFLCEQNMIL